MIGEGFSARESGRLPHTFWQCSEVGFEAMLKGRSKEGHPWGQHKAPKGDGAAKTGRGRPDRRAV